MLDIQTGATAPPKAPTAPIEFVTIQLMPLADGQLSVALKSTVFDDREFDLVDEEIVNERVTTLDELVALIRSHVRINRPAALPFQLS